MDNIDNSFRNNETPNSNKVKEKRWPHILRTKKVSDTTHTTKNKTKNNNNNHQQQNSINHLSIISFNILAESYLTQRSHPNLPQRYQNIAFHKNKRRILLKQTLHKLCHTFYPITKTITDVICLQEVDMYEDFIKDEMMKLKYDSVKTSNNRIDSCCIFWNRDTYELYDSKIINFDDLAILSLSNSIETSSLNKKRPSELTGLVQSFLRKNTAILVLLKHKLSQEKIIISNCHLYWNPMYEYVKLTQCKYLLDECYAFSSRYDCNDVPIIICGDFNSKPGSFVYKFIVDGVIDARRVAPWYYWPADVDDDEGVENNNSSSDKDSYHTSNDEHIENNQDEILSINKLSINDNQYSPLKISSKSHASCNNTIKSNDNISTIESPSTSNVSLSTNVPKVRYIVDFSLNKFSRWLRMFGIDTELETEVEERERTSGVKIALFERAYREKRCLITTSYKLILRKGCPPGSYLINPSKNLKETFCHLLLSHGITLQPSTFLTRCVVCNHNITQVHDEQSKIDIFHKNGLYQDIPDLDVYQCNGCLQGYWWSDRPNSSASRIKNAVSYLFQLAIQFGVPYTNDDISNDDLLDFLQIDEEQQDELLKEKSEMNTINKDMLSIVLKWLHDSELKHSITSLKSAYYNAQTQREELEFTNVTDDFIGLLDYVFYEDRHWSCDYRLDVPVTLKDMNYDNLDDYNSHCIPNDLWPSDHLAIGCLLVKKK